VRSRPDGPECHPTTHPEGFKPHRIPTVRHLGGPVESLATKVNEAGLAIRRYKYSGLTDHPLAWDPAADAVADLNDGISEDASWTVFEA
jgi:hypothetical protein